MDYEPEPITPVIPETMLSVTPDEKLWAMLAHLFGFLGYAVALGQYVGPFVVYVVYKDRSKFVAFHALQSLYFQLLVLVALVVTGALGFVTCGATWILSALVGAAAVIYPIVGAIQAYDGRMFEYWLVGKSARSQVGI